MVLAAACRGTVRLPYDKGSDNGVAAVRLGPR